MNHELDIPTGDQDTSRSTPGARTALVFGASGFIGRWLVKELLAQGIATTAAVRSSASGGRLVAWLEDHGAATHLLDTVQVDLAVDGLDLDPADVLSIREVREVYNVAGAYAFGMTPEDAREANVDNSRRVVEFTATLPDLVRLVHLSGYRVGGQDAPAAPWSAQRRADEYARLGAYEASKVESDAVVQTTALQLGVPLTVANPSTVIGDSVTGESDQLLGLATTVLDVIAGKLRAVPGGSSTFVPVVAVDYLARFMALLPTVEESQGKSYWVLDDDTPQLPALLQLIAEHHDVKLPWLRLPVSVIKFLPTAVTHADPETLSFLSADRYPTGPAQDLARAHGLEHPDVVESLLRWSDFLLNESTRSAQPLGPLV